MTENKIPNIIHFMYFIGPNSREFGFINYLAVRTAYEVQKPKIIYFYYNNEPSNNINWERMKQYVTMVKIIPPTNFMGIEIKYPQYQADIVRLEKLKEHGGIYLDTDILMIKPLTPFMNEECVLGGEGYIDHVSDLHTTDISKIGSISNAVILSKPNSRFISLWLDTLPDGFKKNIWAYHAVVLPFELYKKDTTLFTLQEVEAFIPFDFRDKYIFSSDVKQIFRLNKSYTMHMWETIWRDDISKINDDYLKKVNNIFTHFFKKYAM